MDAQRLKEIREWVEAERALYTRFVTEENSAALNLVRARVFFCAMRDITELLDQAEKTSTLLCGHSADCLSHYTKTGKEVCLRCEYVNKRKKK